MAQKLVFVQTLNKRNSVDLLFMIRSRLGPIYFSEGVFC